MKRMLIKEYPYIGTISHTIESNDGSEDTTEAIYDGVMDIHLSGNNLGSDIESSRYLVYIPQVLNEVSHKVIFPTKGDSIEVQVGGETQHYQVDNAVLSQLGGIEIYVTKEIFDDGTI